MTRYYLVIYKTTNGIEKKKVRAKMYDILDHFIGNESEVLLSIIKLSRREFMAMK